MCKAIREASPITRAHWLPAWGFSCMPEWISIFIFPRTRSSFFSRRLWQLLHSLDYRCRACVEVCCFLLTSRWEHLAFIQTPGIRFAVLKRRQTVIPEAPTGRPTILGSYAVPKHSILLRTNILDSATVSV